MAKLQPQSPPKKRKTTVSCFTACFKLSDEAPPRQRQADTTDNNKNLRRWLYWTRGPSLKKPAATKTVPVDGSPAATVVESKKAAVWTRNDQEELIKTTKRKTEKFRLIGSKRRGREAELRRGQHVTTAEEVSGGSGGEGRIQETLTEEVADHNLELETQTEQAPGDTCPPGRDVPTGRKRDAARSAAAVGSSSGPGSPQIRPKLARSAMSISSSASSRPMTKNSLLKSGPATGKKLEPVVGISVIMVTLVIMILWGRLCAILCTLAWLYFVPKFRATEGSGHQGLNSDPKGLDMESEDYKKKVVLEGLLDRNRRS